ncbi:MAG: sensor histidine kinase [Saprospiraceae bacterium]|nr:sensor histidine kinase [Saprospiraceae bacterium]
MKWFRYSLLVFLMLGLEGVPRAQVNEFYQDSLHLALSYGAADSLDQEALLEHLMQGIGQSRDLQQDYWHARFALRIALYYGVLTGRPDSLYKYSLEAREKFRAIGRQLEEARAMMFLGIAEFQLGHEEPAMQWYTAAGDLYQEIGADSLLASLYINIGHSIKEVDYPLYIEYLKKANSLSRQFNEPRQEAITCLGLTDVYLEKNDPDSAKIYIDRAIILSRELDDSQLLSYSYRNLAITEKSKNNRVGVVQNYQSAINSTKNLRDKAIFYTQLGEYYSDIEWHHSADSVLQIAESLAREIGASQLLELIYGAWRRPLEKSGQLKQALAISNLYIDLKDSLHNENVRATVAELTSKYEIELKEKENSKLLATNIQQELDITKLNLANRNRLFLILILSAFIISGWLFYLNRQKSSQQKLKIAQQDAHIQKQQLLAIQKDQELVAIKSIVQGQEQERGRIAKELHDGLGGIFSTIKLSLDHITKKSERLDEHQSIAHSRSLVDKAGKELRRIAQNMMPSTLSKFGLLVAVEDLVDEMNIQSQVEVSFQHYQVDLEFPEDMSLSIYRIIQELLHNAVKHAEATEILLQMVQHDNHLEIVVEDNGKGFDVSEPRQGAGLLNVESRLIYLNANMKIESEKGNGASISLELPLPDTIPEISAGQEP